VQKKLHAFADRFAIFVEARDGEHGVGVILKQGIMAGAWHGDQPAPETPPGRPEPTSETGAQFLAYWTARPEEWTSLSDEAKAAMLEMIFGVVPEKDPILAGANGATPPAV
jgi:hypothetical protein